MSTWFASPSGDRADVRVGRARYACRLTRDILYYADTSNVRWLTALISLIWGIELILEPSTMARPIYRLMVPLAEVPLAWVNLDGLVAPSVAWGISFAAYGVAAFWRIYEGRPRRWWGFVICAVGFAVWFAMTLAMTLSLKSFAPSMAAEWVISVQLMLVAVRAGLNDEMTSP